MIFEYLLCVSGGRSLAVRIAAFVDRVTRSTAPGCAIMNRRVLSSLACNYAEPPIGIEPMTYALREARALTAHALAALIARANGTDGTGGAGITRRPGPRTGPRPRPSVPAIPLLCVNAADDNGSAPQADTAPGPAVDLYAATHAVRLADARICRCAEMPIRRVSFGTGHGDRPYAFCVCAVMGDQVAGEICCSESRWQLRRRTADPRRRHLPSLDRWPRKGR